MTHYFYKCLPRVIDKRGNYMIEAVQPEHIGKIRNWRNEQMDVLRQSIHITKEEQKYYYESKIQSLIIK